MRAMGITALILAFAAVTLAADQPEANAQAATARVRLVHMSPDAPALDVQLDGQRTAASLAFRSASGYMTLSPGERKLRLLPAGQTQGALIDADLPLQSGQDVTLVVLGRAAEIAVLPLRDDNNLPAAGKAKVRFMHASPDAPPVDIAVRGGPVIFPSVGFKSVAGYVEVDAGTYALEVRPAGTTTVALGLPSVTFRPGQVLTIFGSGLLGDGTLAAVPVDYSTGTASSGLPASGVGTAAATPRTAPALFALFAVALGVALVRWRAVVKQVR